METPDPVQTQIPSHTGIKYLVRGIPPSDDALHDYEVALPAIFAFYVAWYEDFSIPRLNLMALLVFLWVRGLRKFLRCYGKERHQQSHSYRQAAH